MFYTYFCRVDAQHDEALWRVDVRCMNGQKQQRKHKYRYNSRKQCVTASSVFNTMLLTVNGLYCVQLDIEFYYLSLCFQFVIWPVIFPLACRGGSQLMLAHDGRPLTELTARFRGAVDGAVHQTVISTSHSYERKNTIQCNTIRFVKS